MGRYNRQARRAMRKQLGAGAKISNEALETAIDMQNEAMKANKLVPTMSNLITQDLRKKYEDQVNKEIVPRMTEHFLLMTMWVLHSWKKTGFGVKKMTDYMTELYKLHKDMHDEKLGLTFEAMRDCLKEEKIPYEAIIAAADKEVYGTKDGKVATLV